MANTYDYIKQIQQLYKTAGTVFADGLRLGEYSQTTNMEGTSDGTPGVMCRTFNIVATDPNTIFLNPFSIPTVTAPETFTLKLGLNPLAVNPGATLVQVQSTTAIKLDCSRLLNFQSVGPGDASFRISGFDDYFQKVCVDIGPVTADATYPTRCLRYITNITCLSSLGAQTINISTSNFFELPYTDYGCVPPMMCLSTIGPYYAQVQAAGSPTFQTTVGGSYKRANWTTPLTNTLGTVRPIVQNLWNQGGNTQSISGFMGVYGYGYSPDFVELNPIPVNPIIPVIPVNNDPRAIIGIEQYSDGWLDWAG